MRPKADAKGLSLRLDVLAGPPAQLLGGASHLRQVLVHLLGNAVKFTEEGRVGLSVRQLVAEGTRFTLWLDVADTGITPEAQSGIFDAVHPG
nr:ATP-binding protein [Azohydromonas australica]